MKESPNVCIEILLLSTCVSLPSIIYKTIVAINYRESHLTHFGLVTTLIWVNIGSDNGPVA